jgi:hypothetical protein
MSSTGKHGLSATPWRAIGWAGAALLLLAPLLAMQITDEMQWDVADFAMFGAMLVAAWGAFELALLITRKRSYRAGVGIALAAAFLLIWADAAVGVFPR